MNRVRTIQQLAVAVLLAGSTGCGSDKAPTGSVVSPTIATPPAGAGATTPTTTAPAITTTPIATAPPSTAALVNDTAAIAAAFITFFDGGDPSVDHKVAVLESGEALRSMLEDAAADPQFTQLSTVVGSIEPLDDAACAAAGETAPCALVVHDLFVGGLPAMVKLNSHAVQQGGVWKVSRSSWCAIVKIGGASCPVSP